MRKYSFVHAWYLSFFDSSLYRDVKQHWPGYGLAYITLLLALLLAAEFYLKILPEFRYLRDTVLTEVSEKVGEFQIKDGILRIDKDMPIYIYAGQSQGAFAIIDTGFQHGNSSDINAKYVITQSSILKNVNGDLQHVLEFKQFTGNLFNQNGLTQIKQTLANAGFLLPIFYTVTLLSLLFFMVLINIFHVLFAFFFGKINQVMLNFQQAFRLCIVAAPPVILLRFSLDLLQINFAYQGMALEFIMLLFIYFAIVVNGDKPASHPRAKT